MAGKERIYISNDHTGVEMKQAIVKHLTEAGYEVVNLGTDSTEPANYAQHGIMLGEKVVADPGSLGIAICGTGVGISIAADKVKGIRSGLVYELETAQLIRQHDNCNVLATGARMIAVDKALKLVDAFLNSTFEGGRHTERVKTIDDYDESHN